MKTTLSICMVVAALSSVAKANCGTFLEAGYVKTIWWADSRIATASELRVGDVLIGDGLPRVVLGLPQGPQNRLSVRDMLTDGSLTYPVDLPIKELQLDEDRFVVAGHVDPTKLKSGNGAYYGFLNAPNEEIHSKGDLTPLQVRPGVIVRFSLQRAHVEATESFAVITVGFGRVISVKGKTVEIEPLSFTKNSLAFKNIKIKQDSVNRVEPVLDPILSIGTTITVKTKSGDDALGELRSTDDQWLIIDTSDKMVKVAFDEVQQIEKNEKLLRINRSSLERLRSGFEILVEQTTQRNLYTFVTVVNDSLRVQRGGHIETINFRDIKAVWVARD